MDFENNPVEARQLPDFAGLELTPLNSKYLRVMYYSRLSFWLVVLVILVSTFLFKIIPLRWFLPIGGFTLLLALFYLFIVRRAFAIKGYAIRTHDAVYRKGLWFTKTVTVPYRRIQHISVDQGLFHRMLGLAKLKLFNASGSGNFAIPGLPLEDAEKIRAFILEKMPRDE